MPRMVPEYPRMHNMAPKVVQDALGLLQDVQHDSQVGPRMPSMAPTLPQDTQHGSHVAPRSGPFPPVES